MKKIAVSLFVLLLSGCSPAFAAVVGIDHQPIGEVWKGFEYATVAASQTAQVLGASGALGDYIEGLLIVPATTSAGTVALLDNSTSMNVFVTGTLSNLTPIYIPLHMRSVSGAWKLTTGAAVSVIAIGRFTD